MSQSTESKSQPSKASEPHNTSTNDQPPMVKDLPTGRSHEESSKCERINVGDEERLASTVGGAVLTACGLVRSGPSGWLLAALGAALIYRGATGHCSAYKALNVSSARGDRARVGA